ncbi:MAG: hypothetical protein WDN28_13245 [Chthoniobacter sp.]
MNPIAEIVDGIQAALKMERTALHTKGLAFHAEDAWLKTSLQRAPELLAAVRQALHEISREGAAAAAQGLYQRMHGFAEQMAILGQRPLHYLAAQIEALAFDISKFPEQVNPSIVRTLGQALDFLATLLAGCGAASAKGSGGGAGADCG